MRGPTAMGMAGLLRDDADEYTFTLLRSTDALTPDFLEGAFDVACVPASLAASLYQKTNGRFRALAVNALGAACVAERGDAIRALSDLRGRTIYTAGRGTTAEFTLSALLTACGIDPAADVHMIFLPDHAACVTALLEDPGAAAVLSQPFATAAKMRAGDVRIALDLNREWDRLRVCHGAPLITGAAVVRTAFAAEHPARVRAFLTRYEASVRFVRAHPDEAARAIAEAGIFDAELARAALPHCGIVFIAGAEMKEKLHAYLAALCEENPAWIGGALPDDAFYFI